MRHLLLIVCSLLFISSRAQKPDTLGMTDDEKTAFKRIESYRQRVINGESMSVLATLYSEDEGSARTGGQYNNVAKGMFVPEFEAAAWALTIGGISDIFRTKYGFHFVQLLAKHDEMMDVRHILIKTNAK